jgi:hypothetical protein
VEIVVKRTPNQSLDRDISGDAKLARHPPLSVDFEQAVPPAALGYRKAMSPLPVCKSQPV